MTYCFLYPIVYNLSHAHNVHNELPTTVLQTCIVPPSDLRANAMFSDLTGRFPATAIDGSQYLLLSVYKVAEEVVRLLVDAVVRGYVRLVGEGA